LFEDTGSRLSADQSSTANLGESLLLDQLIKQDLLDFLKEDIPYWDISSALVPGKKVTAKVLTKQGGIVAGIGVSSILFNMFNIYADFKVKDGDVIFPSKTLAILEGSSRAILQIERLCLNLLGRMSGIATITRKTIEAAKIVNPAIKVAATRKTTPGFRLYEKLAVQIGGGDTHRFDLSDTVMLKDNHLYLFSDISSAVKAARKTTSVYKKIEVEVKNEKEALEAVLAGADIIMLDNFSPEKIRETLDLLQDENIKDVLIEASGNINIDNIADYATIGVDVISCGNIIHSARALDISMKFQPL
jgi:nicotinate-nucleotide pyrophosphorylase (carboxylating)